MKEKEYNLLEEPWIRVLKLDMEETEVSLTEALTRAHEFKRLAGETATQDAAVFRLLLAIVETVFYRYEVDGTENLLNEEADDALERWAAYRAAGALPKELMEGYLEQYSERFWLFHPEYPFYQVAGLEYGTPYDCSCLLGNIKESMNKATKHHFSLAEGDNLEKISYPAAARWLIYYNAYAVNIKKDKKAPGTENPVGIGRMGRLGFIMIDGYNLFDTLLLNLCALKDGEELWGRPFPTWEAPVCALQAREIPIPDNIPQAYTLQSRRLLLNRNQAGEIVGFRALGGDYYEVENEVNEQMTLWKTRVDKKTGVRTDIPRLHSPSVSIWREFPVLIGRDKFEGIENREPGLMRWLERLLNTGMIPADRILKIKNVGLEYGDAMRYMLGFCIDDELSLSTGILAELGLTWRGLICDEIENCKTAASYIGRFSDGAGELLFGKDSDKKAAMKRKLVEKYYHLLDSIFRNWILSIDPSKSEREQKIQEWQNESRSAAISVIDSYMQSLGSDVLQSRKGEKARILSIPGVYNAFIRSIWHLYQKTDKEKGAQ